MTTRHGQVNHTKGVKTQMTCRGHNPRLSSVLSNEREHDMATQNDNTPEPVVEPQVETTQEITVEDSNDKFVVIEEDLDVELEMKERFAEWAEFQATHATIGKRIRCSLNKTRGDGPYSDATYHTQMNLVLHDKELIKKYPHIVNLKLTKKNKVTSLVRVK